MEETLRVLLVDRDAAARSSLRRSLIDAGITAEVIEAETRAAAIVLLQQEALDCALLDNQLLDGNGLQLVGQVKALEITVPLIVLAEQADEQTAVELLKAGAADYLAKSTLTSESLMRSLFSAVRVHRAEQQAADATKRLHESEERYRLVLDGSYDGIWDWDICKNEVFCNDRLLEIIGIDRESMSTAYETFYQLIHPDDQARVLAAITAHLKQGTAFEVEFRLRHASGGYRYCVSQGRAQRDEQNTLSQMSGIVSDITTRKQAEDEIVKLNRDLERRVVELQTLFDVLPIGIAITDDPTCQALRINPTYAEMLGIPPETHASFTSHDSEHPPYRLLQQGQELPSQAFPMQSAAATGRSVLDAEFDILRDDGTLINVIGYATPLFDQQHPDVQRQLRGCVGAFLDITSLKRAEATQRFLADASSVLAASLDYQTILHNIAQLAVPTLADCCFFDILNNQNAFQLLTWQHVDPAKQGWFSRAQQHTPTLDQEHHPVVQCLTTGQTVFLPEVTDAWLESIAVTAEHLQFLRDLEIGSLMTLPLIVHDRKLGALTLCLSRPSGRRYTTTDQQLAAALAQRAALAIDNAQLYRSTQDTERDLRHALIILGQHQQQLRTLQRLTDLLNQRLTNLPELLQVMVTAVCEVIPNAEFGLIVLQNPYTGMLELTAATGTGTDRFRLEEDFAPGEGLLGEIFVTGGSRLIQESGVNVIDSTREAEAAMNEYDLSGRSGDAIEARERWRQENPTRLASDLSVSLPPSFCVVAIESAQAGRLGVLAIGNWTNPAAFNDDNLQLLVAFGEQAAIALTNAQLINTLEEREERLEVQNRILGEQNQELEEQRQQIHFQNLRLQEAAKLKSQFMATMSHELRTPMNAVIGFSQLLLRQQLMPSQRDMIDRILSNGRNLLALINDILDLSKIEAGRLELVLETINLHQLVTATVEELRSLVDQKQLTLDVQLTLQNPLIINDSTRLRQVLVNLLSNAIKFTEAGGVQIVVTECEPDTIVLSVHDTGVGIADAHLDYIFEAFYQLDQTLAKKFPGTGLGLAITDLIIRKMNGTITVESELDAGSTFYVTLPRRVSATGSDIIRT